MLLVNQKNAITVFFRAVTQYNCRYNREIHVKKYKCIDIILLNLTRK